MEPQTGLPSPPAQPPTEGAGETASSLPPTSGSRPAEDRPLRELRGVVERITYQNLENGYTVGRLAAERKDEAGAAADDRLVTVVGTLADLTPGEAIVAHGWWHNDPRHGWQFKAVEYRTALPASVQGMKKYLGSGLVKGVGPVTRVSGDAVSSSAMTGMAGLIAGTTRSATIAGNRRLFP